jgi:hypothetical protein
MPGREVCSPMSRPGSRVGSGQPQPRSAASHHVNALTPFHVSLHMRVLAAMWTSLQK